MLEGKNKYAIISVMFLLMLAIIGLLDILANPNTSLIQLAVYVISILFLLVLAGVSLTSPSKN